jgi:hypothetical protein
VEGDTVLADAPGEDAELEFTRLVPVMA